ncbi:hypothetical protein Tco_1352936 [Tanacetum coccineum]
MAVAGTMVTVLDYKYREPSLKCVASETYSISEDLHPELPGPKERIVDFPEGKVGVYTKFLEFANFHLLISQFLFDILGHYQIHLSQLSVIGAAKVSHFKINCLVLHIIPSLNLFRVFYIPSFNAGWMPFSKRPGKNTPQCYTKPLDSLKNWNNQFFWVDERVFPTVVDWRINAPKDEMPVEGSYSAKNVAVLNTRRTPIQKQPEALLCVVGLSRRYFLGASNPTKVKTGTRPRAAHEVPLLTATANRMIVMEDATVASGSSGTPSTVEKSPLDFTNEDSPQRITEGDGITEPRLEKEVVAMGPPVNKWRRKRDNAEAEANASPKVLRKDHAPACPEQSTRGGKSLDVMGLGADSTFTSGAQETPADVSDPEPLSYAKPHPSSRVPATEIPVGGVATIEVLGLFSAESSESKRSMSVPSVEGSPGAIYQPGWGVTNDCRLDTPEACQDMVDHTVPSGYFSELRHLPNTEFLAQYNINLARQVALGSQLRLREEEIKRLGEEVESLKVVETEVHGLRNQTKNLETLLEAEVDMKKATEAKNAELAKELESLRAKFSDLQLNNNQLSQQVSTLQAQVTGEERIKAIFEEFKKYEDDKVEKRCAEMDVRLDALSIDFDEELYPHMLTAIAGRRWVIGHGLRLAVMKCTESIKLRWAFANVVSAGITKGMSEGLKYGVKQGEGKLDLAAIEAYDPEADNKHIATLHALKDLKYPLIDQLEKLKDAPLDLIMASLHLESDTGEDAPQWIQELLLRDAIAANISHAKKKKKYKVVCRTHGIGSAHHARSDGVPVSVPTVAPQGLAILLADAATQTDISEDKASPRLLRSKSLPPMYNLDWP